MRQRLRLYRGRSWLRCRLRGDARRREQCGTEYENSLREHVNSYFDLNFSWQDLQSLPTAATAALSSSPALLLFSTTSASVLVCVARSATSWSNSLRLVQIAGSARVLPSLEISGYASPTKVAICARRVACFV